MVHVISILYSKYYIKYKSKFGNGISYVVSFDDIKSLYNKKI